ncbi:MAG: hypothetical protein H6729_00700 [Deltaproteobacteria bacterium]|nr:hypothetical protein [Deltaproteobacteria bacterium]
MRMHHGPRLYRTSIWVYLKSVCTAPARAPAFDIAITIAIATATGMAFATFGLSLGCVALDRRPPWSASSAYARSLGEIEAAASRATSARGILNIGWARVPIRVPGNAPLAGYGERVHLGHAPPRAQDALYVRAFALEVGTQRAIIFAADLLLIERPLADRVRAQIDAAQPGTHVFFTASHTHSGPGGYARGAVFELALGPFDAHVLDALAGTFTHAGLSALADRAPAHAETAEVIVEGVVTNRIERQGPIDDTLVLFLFSRADGRRAALYSFGCHPTTRPRESLALSADYPGDVARALEGIDVEVLAFAAGGVGSAEPANAEQIAPRLIVEVRKALRMAERSTGRSTERSTHPSSARPLVPRGSRNESQLAFARVTLPFPPVRYRIFEDLMLPAPLVTAVIGFDRFELGALVLNNAGMLFVPAELSGEITRAARRAAHRNGLATLAVLPFDGTYAGYVGSRRAYDLPREATLPLYPYETQTLSFLGPWGADLLANLSLRFLSGVRVRAQQASPRLSRPPRPSEAQVYH